jgi:uroporphyrinogen decarboxylase-like protein
MNNRQRIHAVLHYESYDRMPLVHFGYWNETVEKWAAEGHVTEEEVPQWDVIARKLGFDCGWGAAYGPSLGLRPGFEREVLEELPDGMIHVRNHLGATVVEKKGVRCIPAEVDHLLKDRASWEEHYKWRFAWSEERITESTVNTPNGRLGWTDGGLEFLQSDDHDEFFGITTGSLYGGIRDMMGMENLCYLGVDDPELYDEIIDTIGNLIFRTLEYVLKAGAKFDFGHFWEDICFKSGPLVAPSVFAEKVGPHYKRITDLLREHGADIVSLDCDGKIDALVPIWLENGVNTMFPIEVGTWHASIAPWREKYGRDLRGVGGMNKNVFAQDRAAIDAEVERLKPLIDLGGFIPCPDHRIPPGAKWAMVRYYCDLMRK